MFVHHKKYINIIQYYIIQSINIIMSWISILYTDWFFAFCDFENKAKLF